MLLFLEGRIDEVSREKGSQLMAGPELYNSKIINAYIKLIRSKYSYINIAELLSMLEWRRYQMEDPGALVHQEQIDRFYEKSPATYGQ